MLRLLYGKESSDTADLRDPQMTNKLLITAINSKDLFLQSARTCIDLDLNTARLQTIEQI